MRDFAGAAAMVVLMSVLGGLDSASAQSVEKGVLIIEAPNIAAATALDPADIRWAYSIRGWTCIDGPGSVDDAIEGMAVSVAAAIQIAATSQFGRVENGALKPEIAKLVDEAIGVNVSTDAVASTPVEVNRAPAPGQADTALISNCFRTSTQADVDKLKKALTDRVALAAFALAAKN